MLDIYQLREKYGISIGELANYLGISKSLAAKAATLERSLPPVARAKLVALQAAAAKHTQHQEALSPAVAQQQQAKIYHELIKDLQHRVVRCRHKANKLTDKLEKIKNTYPSIANFLELIEHLAPFVQGPNLEDVKDKIWMMEMQDAAKKKLKHNNPDVQMEMRIAIDMFHAEANVLQEVINHTSTLLLAITPSAEVIDDTKELPDSALQLTQSPNKETIVKKNGE